MDRYDELATLLKKRPMTAKEIADRTGCSVPTVYARLKVLAKRGFVIASERVPAQPDHRGRMVKDGNSVRRAHRTGPICARWSVR